MLGEIILRHVFPVFSTYSELSGGSGYVSPFTPLSQSRNLEYLAGAVIADDRKEFGYTYQANEFGFFEKCNSKNKAPEKLRILCVGDSFTHGIGAPQDSCWPRSLEAHLNQFYGSGAEVINAGLQGADPVYSLDFVEKSLFDVYQPDVVLLAINTTDMYELILRGGTERFVNDSVVRYRPAPWWEPIFASSNVVRGFIYLIGYNGYLLKESEMKDAKTEAIETIRERLLEFVKQLNTRGEIVHVGVILHPLVGEIVETPETNFYDAFEPPNAEWFTIDMFQAFVSDGRITPHNTDFYFWPIDQHHTPKGYWLFGELAAERLVKIMAVENRQF